VVFFALLGMVFNWSKTFKVSYYETLLERYESEAGIKLPNNYQKVKEDFWLWVK
jgi:hypothetical protein